METANRITMVSFVFSCLIHSACFCSFEKPRWQKGAARLPFVFLLWGFLFDIKENRLLAYQWWHLSIDCFVLLNTRGNPTVHFQKKWSVLKSAFFGAKRISIVNSLFSSLSPRNTKSTTWDSYIISIVIIEKRRRLNWKWK